MSLSFLVSSTIDIEPRLTCLAGLDQKLAAQIERALLAGAGQMRLKSAHLAGFIVVAGAVGAHATVMRSIALSNTTSALILRSNFLVVVVVDGVDARSRRINHNRIALFCRLARIAICFPSRPLNLVAICRLRAQAAATTSGSSPPTWASRHNKKR